MTEKYNELSKEMEIQTAMCQVHTCMLCMRTSVTQVVEEEWYNHTLQDVLSLHYLNRLQGYAILYIYSIFSWLEYLSTFVRAITHPACTKPKASFEHRA